MSSLEETLRSIYETDDEAQLKPIQGFLDSIPKSASVITLATMDLLAIFGALVHKGVVTHEEVMAARDIVISFMLEAGEVEKVVDVEPVRDEIVGPVVLTPSKEVPGQYVIHDLLSDVVTQGNSPEHALTMLRDALDICRTEDTKAGFGPRDPAPKEDWPPGMWKTWIVSRD